MKTKKILLAATILAAMCSNVFAGSDQVPKDRKITEISVYENDVIIKFTPSFVNTQSCTEGSTSEIVIDLESGQGKTLYSAALAAASSGKNVGFGLNGCKSSPKVYRIDIAY